MPTVLGSHPSDVRNIVRALLAPMIFFLPVVTGFPEGFAALGVFVIYYFIGDTNYLLHLHVHRPFTRNRAFNLLLDLAMASVTAMTASNWRIQHVYGHHRGIDVLFRGEAAWELERYTPMRAISFCLRSIGPTFWRPLAISFRRGVLQNETRPINYRWAFVEHMLLIGLVAALAAIDLSMTLTYVIPMYLLTYFITRYVDYLNHYGCDEASPDKYEHANNSLSPSFNRYTHNFGYHTAHHLRPGAHWTDLPEIYAGIEDRIPGRCKKTVSWSFMLFPYHLYLGLRGRM